MNTEQLRAEFEAWYMREFEVYPRRNESGGFRSQYVNAMFKSWKGGRVALQSKPIESAAREFALWAYGEVGADPELTPGLAQLLHHFGISDDVPVALQSQTRKEPSEWLKQHEALMYRVSKAAIVVGYGGTINCATAEQALENEEKALLDHARTLQSQDSERLDFITSKPGVCYALVSDDNGRWALTDSGMSAVAPDQGFTETVGITSIVDPDMWKNSPREAIDHARRNKDTP